MQTIGHYTHPISRSIFERGLNLDMHGFRTLALKFINYEHLGNFLKLF